MWGESGVDEEYQGGLFMCCFIEYLFIYYIFSTVLRFCIVLRVEGNDLAGEDLSLSNGLKFMVSCLDEIGRRIRKNVSYVASSK